MERIKQALDKARAEREANELGARAFDERSAPRSRIESEESAIAYSQTKVVTPNKSTLRENRVIFDESDPLGLAAYKMLRTQVLQRMKAREWNTLGITSPAPGDGKTLTATNLAISLARELHHTVLLVDTDLRNPSVHKTLGLRPDVGIGDFLNGNARIEQVMVNPGIDRLVILPGRLPVPNSSEVLASPAMGDLVAQLSSRYSSRIILFDLPPVLSADDALSFAPFVDAFLLVLRDGRTARHEIEQSMEIMKDAAIIGTVLNASDEKISAYY